MGWDLIGFYASMYEYGHPAPFSTVTWEIDQGYPFMSDECSSSWFTCHTRAVVGYYNGGEQYALINDPAPTGTGSQYWENRASSLEVPQFTE